MKILQINVVYDTGSTGKITADLHRQLLSTGHESLVCCSRLKKTDDKNVINLCGVHYSHMNVIINAITGFMHGGCWLSTWKLMRIIERERPDIVHLQCINGAFVNIYRLLAWLKEKHIKTVCALHAEFMYTGGCGYTHDCDKWLSGCGNCSRYREETRSLIFDRAHAAWMKMQQAVQGFQELTLVPVSHWIGKQAAASPIYKGVPQRVIHNGINTECFESCDVSCAEQLKQDYGIPRDKKIVLHVTPQFLSPFKGGEYFSVLADRLPEEYQAVVVGYDGPPTDKFIGIRYVENQKQLATFYSIADVFVLTSKCDNYPTVCLEANCCGTPVVGFDVCGVKETIGEGMGEVVSPFDVDAMLEKVLYWSQKKSSISRHFIESRIAYCAKERMLKDYLDLYNEVLGQGGTKT